MLEMISPLYVPASHERMMQKAEELTCDIIFDLEDAVELSQKAAARRAAAGAIEAIKKSGRSVLIRVNAMDTGWGAEDIEAVLPFAPHALIIPKASPEAMKRAHSLIEGIDPYSQMQLVPLIETAAGVEALREILTASARIGAAQFGAEDYTSDMGIVRTSHGSELQYARNKMAVCCRAHRIPAWDTPYPDYQDIDGLKNETIWVRQMGFYGKAAIHPSQTSVIIEAFMPSEEELTEAEAITAAYKKGVEQGLGAVGYHGKLLDAPIVERAEKLLRRAAFLKGGKQ